MTRARINRLAYIGWRGIHGCEVLELDEGPLTGLIGPSGAGKTTLVMCLDYALLPDRKALNIKPISDIQDSQKAGLDTLSSRIDPRYGYSYAALDIHTRHEGRLIAGIFVQAIDGSANFTRWIIKNAPPEMPLQDVFAIADGDSEYHPDFPELRRHLATKGIDVIACRSVGEYGQAMHDAGILPSNMSLASDRTLYANLIETTFRGGISHQVATRLKEYLLPEAAQIPEIIRGLEECTNELIKTRSAVKDANKELDLLRATYGIGKEITLHSLRWILHDVDQFTASLASLESLQTNSNIELQMISESIPKLEEQIRVIEEAKSNAIKNAGHELNLANEDELALTRQLPQLEGALKVAISNKSLFEQSGKSWRELADKNGLSDFDAAIRWLDERDESCLKRIVSMELKIESLQEERDRLFTGQSSLASEILAERIGGVSLEHALRDVNEADGLSIEIGLSGLVDGVVGVDIDELPKLGASDELPQIFWLGKSAPAPSDLHEVGEWVLKTTNSGYIVANRKYRSMFGSEARKNRRNAIQVSLDDLSRQRTTEQLKHDSFRNQGIEFRKNKDGILFYLENKADTRFISDAVTNAQARFDACLKKLGEAKSVREQKQRALQDIQLPFDKQISHLRLELSDKETKKNLLTRNINDYGEKCDGVRRRLSSAQADLESARTLLGADFNAMHKDSLGIIDFKIENLISMQARRLAKLNDSLRNETPTRQVKLQEINAEDRVSMIQIWPILLEIVREFIHTDLADAGGVDLIQAMQERRANLDGELMKQENEVKIKARNISTAIRANVQSQKKKIEKLSEFGRHIQFGNVVGIQIKLSPRTDMLAVLEEFALQTSLFSDQRPVDEVLRDFFNASLIRKIDMTGEALLDYRNYVDLVIEAMRKAADWEPASELSGGEAIGCGLAIALMLTRSIASKGEIKVDQIAPLFAVDEVQRLHPEGQTLLVDFARREGFQIIVTATTMEPGFKCTLYALNRVYEPNERLVIRGVKVKRDATPSSKVVQ